MRLIKVLFVFAHLVRLAFARAFSAQGERRPQEIRRILFLAYSPIGDMIFLLPTIRAVRAAFPNARLVVAGNTYPSFDELLPAAGLADEIWKIEAPYGHGQGEASILRRVVECGFDAVILSLPASARYFGTSLLGIPIRIGHCRAVSQPKVGWSWPQRAAWSIKRGLISEEWERRIILNRKVWIEPDGEHAVLKNMRLAEALGSSFPNGFERPCEVHIPVEAERRAAQLLKPQDGITIGLHVGSPASQYEKIWPARRWGEVAALFSQERGVRFVLFGGASESGMVEEFRRAYRLPFVNLVGQCDLLTTFAVIKRCDALLANDTGLSKAAMALGIRTATVWGPSDRHGNGVFWDRERHLEIYREMPCSPCVRLGLRNEGPGVINYSDCGHHGCLADMTPAVVATAVSRWLFPQSAASGS